MYLSFKSEFSKYFGYLKGSRVLSQPSDVTDVWTIFKLVWKTGLLPSYVLGLLDSDQDPLYNWDDAKEVDHENRFLCDWLPQYQRGDIPQNDYSRLAKDFLDTKHQFDDTNKELTLLQLVVSLVKETYPLGKVRLCMIGLRYSSQNPKEHKAKHFQNINIFNQVISDNLPYKEVYDASPRVGGLGLLAFGHAHDTTRHTLLRSLDACSNDKRTAIPAVILDEFIKEVEGIYLLY